MLIGRGFGQQDRMTCVLLCLLLAAKAGHSIAGAVFASDGFFPFATSVRQLLRVYIAVFKACLRPRRILSALWSALARLDRREGPELLFEAGCIGGVVPADGKHLEDVQYYFGKRGLVVHYVDAENRGFARH